MSSGGGGFQGATLGIERTRACGWNSLRDSNIGPLQGHQQQLEQLTGLRRGGATLAAQFPALAGQQLTKGGRSFDAAVGKQLSIVQAVTSSRGKGDFSLGPGDPRAAAGSTRSAIRLSTSAETAS